MTKKIVINACFGGFSLSHKAVLHYAKLKGITLYPEEIGSRNKIYHLIPKDQREPEPTRAVWIKWSLDKCRAWNKTYNQHVFSPYGIPRDDPFLVQTVEELGIEANGSCAELKIVEIPDDVEWEIDEYDGKETIDEVHRSWS